MKLLKKIMGGKGGKFLKLLMPPHLRIKAMIARKARNGVKKSMNTKKGRRAAAFFTNLFHRKRRG